MAGRLIALDIAFRPSEVSKRPQRAPRAGAFSLAATAIEKAAGNWRAAAALVTLPRAISAMPR
jgi:hypothetical protein